VSYGVGVDLGTSFTSAAVSESGGVRMVRLGTDVIVPSVVYPGPDGALLTGENALAVASDPARIARNFKRRLGDPTPLMLNGAGYSPAALMAAQLRDVLGHVSEAMRGAPGQIVLTCPAIWGPYRREHFTEVLRLADVSDYRLVTEPEAAATHYGRENRLGDGEVVAVYDLGGGTFDTTILRMRANGMEILGTPDGIEHMGGVDFDETLLAHVDDRLAGAVSALDPTDEEAVAALARIRAMCVRAKEELSTEPDVRLSVPLPSGSREITVTRLEFNDMITPAVRQTTAALRRTISSAGLAPGDLSAVLLAGGSSSIPLISQLVSEEFGKPVRVALHPKFTVALGAAAIAARPEPAVQVQPAAPVQLATGLPTRGSRPAGRWAARKWLVPTIAAAAALVAVTTLLFVRSGGEAQGSAPTSRVGSSTTSPPPLPTIAPMSLFNGGFVAPYRAFVADATNGKGTDITAGEGAQPSIAALSDGKELKVSWKGDSWGAIFIQSPGHTRDLSPYVTAGAALIFDVTVLQPPTEYTAIEVHCIWRCGAMLRAEKLFQQLPTGSKTTVSIPLSCFTVAGLNATRVDTPFVVHSEAEFSAVFSNVRWEQQATTGPTDHSCEPLP
jgi:molecular chaperone DnaK